MAAHIEEINILDIEKRIIRALKTIRVLPDPEARFMTYRTAWPEFPQDFMDAYNSDEVRQRFKPSPFDVGDCLTALSWLRGIQPHDTRFIHWRSHEVSFRQIGDKIGTSDETARTRYRDAMVRVWANANSYSQDNFGKLRESARKSRCSGNVRKKVA